ncbi:MAG: tetratricopeptide repeat protein [Vicinamibacterales bacterium]
MDAGRWQRVQGLFHEVVDLPVGLRDSILDSVAIEDPALVRDVRAMVAEDQCEQPLLDGGLAPAAERLFSGTSGPPEGRFGRYQIHSVIGEGGMGVVYRAERPDLGLTVAVKVLRDAWLSPARRVRFQSEQRTLAQLRHPGIAALHDADVLPDGTPWFAMEYVEGEGLSAHCHAQRPDVRRRLELFREICVAVQHAHEHLVVHRDLKPSNVMVTSEGAVKLLDFGIAKQLDDDGDAAERTRTGLRLMTPAYASPQQVRGEPAGIDTDVYSLGVILFELLSGTLPFDLSGCTQAEAERIILDVEPPKPSVAAARTPAARRLDVPRRAWGDLDVLCLAAMHKDPRRRYRTVQALIQDLDHFLDGEPLDARPDTLGYRTGKFVRRNRAPLAVAGAAVAGIVGVVTFYTYRLAKARNAAVLEARRANRIQAFMLNLFDGGDLEAGPAEDLRVSTLLERGVREADGLASEPVDQAELYQALGHIHQKLGHFDEADVLLQRARRARERLFGPEGAEAVHSLVALARLRTDQAQYDEADRFAGEALERARRSLDPDDPLVAAATEAQGRILQERGSYDEAVPVLEQAVRLHERGGESVELANSIHELANVHFYAGRYEESSRLNHRVLGMYARIVGEGHPHVGDTLVNLGAIEFERGDYPEAERLFRQGLAIIEAWYGGEHYRTAGCLTMLGRTLARLEKRQEASVALERALAGRVRTYGPNHPSVASVVNELGTIARLEKRFDQAEAHYRRMADIYRAVYGNKPHYLVGVALSNLGSVAHDRGRLDDADTLLQQAIDTFTTTLPAGHVNIGIGRVKRGGTLIALGRVDEAERETTAGLEILSGQMKPDAPWLQAARTSLSQIAEARRPSGA